MKFNKPVLYAIGIIRDQHHKLNSFYYSSISNSSQSFGLFGMNFSKTLLIF